ncbi:MAG: hypothetical protein HUU43_12180 [Ignavibacteriaceae bacterium]|nr:hypothetical protein [Ignavibacteriaceae bacterium]
MKSLFSSAIALLFLLPNLSFAQITPYSFKEGKGVTPSASFKSENPVSNSITAMLVVGDTVWLGTSRGLSRSVDNGSSWSNFYGSAEFGIENISALAYDRENHILWAATAHSADVNGESLPEGSGLRYTTDGGSTWTVIPQPVDADNDSVVIYGNNRLRALPVTVTIQNIIYDAAVSKGGVIWVATFAGGLRKSTDRGQTWQRVVLPPDYLNSVKPEDNLSFCLSPVPGKFCAEGNLNHRVFSVHVVNDTVIYAGTANGINKSTDNGISWVKLNHQNQTNPISGNFVVAINSNPDNANELWAATWKAEAQDEFYAVSYTLDGGSNWFTTLYDERANNFTLLNGQVIAAASGGLFKSSDRENWVLPGNIVDSRTKIPVLTSTYYSAAFAENGNVLYLGSNEGLIKNYGFSGTWLENWKVYYASQPLNTRNSAYAFPNPFSPKTDLLKIKYNTNGKTAQVTIRIFDFAMNYVRTLIQNAPRGNPFNQINSTDPDGVNGVLDLWDGKDDNGNVVPNGVYFYKIEIDSETPIVGKVIVLQ